MNMTPTYIWRPYLPTTSQYHFSLITEYRIWFPPCLNSCAYLRHLTHRRKQGLKRNGRQIIPQINFDETNEGNPYVCFRHCNAKPLTRHAAAI